ncbi:Thermostable hemolysin [compost metagenome]
MGNLAAFGNGSARLLIVALTNLLVAQGFRWVVFTGTPALLNSFQRLALTPIALGLADPARMGDELADWGSYYASRPQVMAGEILPGHQRLLQLGAYPRLGYQPLFNVREVAHAACS